ncbi:MAG: VWA domain-containing protein, partial [Verrucomicrobiales bacterium]|nr:VWA domain-containing protein [Verrucomicrobiales bacterium]
MSRWSFAASSSVLLLGFAVWIAAGCICWTIWQRSGRRKAVGWLEALRLVLITLLGFTLLRPEFVRQLERSARPEVLVLLDGSSSMKTRDIITSNGVVSRTDWLTEQRAKRFWKSVEPAVKVTTEDFATPPSQTNATTGPAIEGTDLNQALEDALQRQRNLKALLLLTDGDWNQGKSPIGTATRYREQEIPIFAVAVGRETPVPDLILESVSPPSFGLFGEQISIPFKVQNHLTREVRTTVALLDGKREEVKKEIVIPPLRELQDAVLWSPRVVGDAALTLKLPVEKDEGLPENNEKSFRVNVRVETLKVLVVDSLPRWEYRYLRNALARDPGVEMHSLLFHPSLAAGGGRGYLSAFPNTKEAISKYDVIFLGDVGLGQNELTEQHAELIKGLVEQQSSGLVLLPGRRGRQLTLLDTPLRDLMPVLLDPTRPEGIGLQNESVLLPTTGGRRHWMTRFESDEIRNEEIWKQLPGFYWSAAVEKSRPGSEVIAVHSAQRNSWGRIPLLVTRPAG